jgi:hypothetical protein
MRSTYSMMMKHAMIIYQPNPNQRMEVDKATTNWAVDRTGFSITTH